MKKKNKKVTKILLRGLICLLTAVVFVVAFAFSGVAVINYGPSATFRDLFVMSMLETSAAKFLATWYFNDEALQAIIDANSVAPTTGRTDPGLIVIPSKETETDEPDIFTFPIPVETDNTGTGYVNTEPVTNRAEPVTSHTEPVTSPPTKESDIEVFDVIGDTYKGKMMVVKDPSRLFVGTCGVYGEVTRGKTVMDLGKSYNATAAVNGGGFEDVGGQGSGAIPTGIVISQGELLWGTEGKKYGVIGFTDANILVVGSMTPAEAIEMGVRDAVSFGPILIMNGVASDFSGYGGGLNPRTAIGQRSDGAVLLLVIDGRRTESLGATYSDLIEIMLEYGAVNAANLDGGQSSMMYYNGKYVNLGISPRKLPTCFIVK